MIGQIQIFGYWENIGKGGGEYRVAIGILAADHREHSEQSVESEH